MSAAVKRITSSQSLCTTEESCCSEKDDDTLLQRFTVGIPVAAANDEDIFSDHGEPCSSTDDDFDQKSEGAMILQLFSLVILIFLPSSV